MRSCHPVRLASSATTVDGSGPTDTVASAGMARQARGAEDPQPAGDHRRQMQVVGREYCLRAGINNPRFRFRSAEIVLGVGGI